MKKGRHRELCIAVCLLAAFALWTTLVRLTDVQAIGPRESAVGFATVNKAFHDLTGVHMSLYIITDWLGLVPVIFALGFGILGLAQWIRRKHLLRVDRDILVLGGFYVVVMAAYLLFEVFVVNYRPVLIGGVLEASYPSSHTMIVVCIMATAVPQVDRLWPNKQKLCAGMAIFATFIMVITVIGRLISGVHWFTDIAGGLLLAGALVTFHRAVIQYMDEHGPSK